MKNYKINIIFYNTSTHFIVLYPNRTQRHLKNPYKAHKYRLCRDLSFYSNSSQRKYHQIKNADFMRHSTASISSNVTLFMSFSKTLVAN